MKPLQTHGLFDETWIPPRGGQYFRYEPSDEPWMRPLGLGTIQRTPRPLYDVRSRDAQLTLIGYVEWNPAEYDRPLHVALSPRITAANFYDSTARFEPLAQKTLEPRTIRWQNQEFACWLVPLQDGPALIEGGVIKMLDKDRLREHLYNLECHIQHMNLARYGMPLRSVSPISFNNRS